MKKILTIIAVASAATSMTFAQGTVNFDTSSSTIGGTGARIIEAQGFQGAGVAIGNTAGGALAGTNYLLQLFAAAGTTSDSASLVAIGIPVNARGGVANGSFSQTSGTTSLGAAVDSAVLIPFLAPGGPVTIQLRAWYTVGGTVTSWEQVALSSSEMMRFGASPLLTLASTGNPNAQPPETPANLVGLQGFTLQAVPEPSSMALAGLGAAALVFFRRRK